MAGLGAGAGGGGPDGASFLVLVINYAMPAQGLQAARERMSFLVQGKAVFKRASPANHNFLETASPTSVKL
jgi:hypothetical protein